MSYEWVTLVYVALQICGMTPEGTTYLEGRTIWVQPKDVSGFGEVKDAQDGGTCTRIIIHGRTIFVIGSPQEVYGKLTRPFTP